MKHATDLIWGDTVVDELHEAHLAQVVYKLAAEITLLSGIAREEPGKVQLTHKTHLICHYAVAKSPASFFLLWFSILRREVCDGARWGGSRNVRSIERSLSSELDRRLEGSTAQFISMWYLRGMFSEVAAYYPSWQWMHERGDHHTIASIHRPPTLLTEVAEIPLIRVHSALISSGMYDIWSCRRHDGYTLTRWRVSLPGVGAIFGHLSYAFLHGTKR